ncbi:MAG: hypothetical protein II983_04525, partial [Firmicutes bacterium]|nr:hypothetical protein [Bacillota bacterium]
MDNVAGLLKTLKGYMGFQAVDGTLAVTAEMPEKFYDVYLTALTLTGKVDLTDLNAVETEIAYTFLADYVKILTGEGVDATTYVNTLKKLGKEDLLAGYETYIDELLGMLGDSFTYDEEAENYALSLTASKELLEKILAIFGGDNLGSVTGLIKEMKDGGALIIPLTAEVTNFNDNNAAEDKYEAFIVNQGALNQGGLDKLEVVNISTNLAADLVNSSGFNVVILQKNLGDDEHPVNLVIDADTNAYLDLNGKIITGNVTVNGQLTLIDSTFDTANAGGINGELFGNNISVIAGKYTTDVAKWLKSGYVQAEGAADELKAVSNELYTMTKQAPMAMRRAAQTPNEIVTVTLNTDLLQNRQDLNKSMAKAVAVDLASDLLMNFYTAASLSFGTEMEIYDIDDAELTTLLQWYADGITEIDAVNKALDCLNEEGLMNFINQVIEDMTDFETIAKGEVIASYDISSKCWTIVVEKQPDNSFDGGIAANPDLTKALTLNIEIAGEKEEVITDLAAELDKIVTSAIAIDEIE